MAKDIYGEPTIIKVGNVIGKVYSPILSETEYNRRMEAIKKSATRLVLAKERKSKQ